MELFEKVTSVEQLQKMLPRLKNAKQIALCGRSNVGKSTLINCLSNQKIAKTSSSPGKTKALYFYTLSSAEFLVDLPGYGYAKASQSAIKAFSNLIEGYMHAQAMDHALILLDIRHSPSKLDRQMISFLAHHSIPFSFVYTKSDQVRQNARSANIKKWNKELLDGLGVEPVHSLSVSHKDGKSIKDLLKLITTL